MKTATEAGSGKPLKQLRKEKDEENEARALLEEMQQNSETEQRLYRELEEYMYSLDGEFGRPQNISDTIWANDAKQRYEVGEP